jgi:caffeoyl-CoA O-methyltransferase
MLITQDLLHYAECNSTPPPPYLAALERETNLKTTQPIMLSGALQGRFLSFISKMVRPQCILEIGTFTGYSALCLAEGLAPKGTLHTIEYNDELQPIIDKYICMAAMQNVITVHFGKALQVLPTLAIKPDLVFIDADKPNYINYLNAVLPMLTDKAIILVDNVLFHGQVLEATKSKNAAAIAEFNAYVASQTNLEVLMLPIRDGITLVRRQ